MKSQFRTLLVATSLVGCGDTGGTSNDAAVDAEGPPELPTVTKFDIAGAGSLVLAPTAQARTKKGTANAVPGDFYRLQRVNLDGSVAEVTIEDANGNAVTSQVQVDRIIDADTHVLFQIEISSPLGAALRRTTIIVTRKSDGASFEVSSALPEIGCQQNFSYAQKAGSDDHGGVYVAIPCGSMNAENVVRLDTSASPPTASLALPTDTHVADFAVDAAGNIAYVASLNGSPGVWRARSAAGQTKNLPMLWDPWTGPDSVIHFIGGTVDACTATEGCTSDLSVGNGTIDVVIGAQGGALRTFNGEFSRFATGSDVYFVSPHTQTTFGMPVVISRWRAGQTQAYQTTWPDHAFRAAAGSSTHVFIAGLDMLQNPVLVKFDMSNLTAPPVPVIPGGVYDITQLKAAADGTLTFAGLRLSDSKEVVGRVSPTGVATVSSEYTAPVGTLVPL